jgi:hypothetical protein
MTNHDLAILRDPVALLVLRAWIELGSSLPLRAYIRETADVSRGFERSSTVTDVDAAVDAVRAWLEGMLAEHAADAEPEDLPGSGTNGAGPRLTL